MAKFNRYAAKPPDYLHILRKQGSRRQFRLVWQAANNRYKEFPQGTVFSYYDWMSKAHKELYNVKGSLAKEPTGVFLDAGCGNSPDALIATLTGYQKAYKVDLFPPTYYASISYWPKLEFDAEEKRKEVEYIKGDICEFVPLEDNSVDTIVCSAVLDLVKPGDRILFYQQAYRLLKPGGLLSVYMVFLKNGYGYNDSAMDVPLSVGFEEVRCYPRHWPDGFILRKPS